MRAELAMNLYRQGRLVEAEVEIRKVLKDTVDRAGRNNLDTADILLKFVQVISAQGRLAEAEKLARTAIDVLLKAGAVPESGRLATARALLGGVLVSRRQWRAAVDQFSAIRQGLKPDPETFER